MFKKKNLLIGGTILLGAAVVGYSVFKRSKSRNTIQAEDKGCLSCQEKGSGIFEEQKVEGFSPFKKNLKILFFSSSEDDFKAFKESYGEGSTPLDKPCNVKLHKENFYDGFVSILKNGLKAPFINNLKKVLKSEGFVRIKIPSEKAGELITGLVNSGFSCRILVKVDNFLEVEAVQEINQAKKEKESIKAEGCEGCPKRDSCAGSCSAEEDGNDIEIPSFSNEKDAVKINL